MGGCMKSVKPIMKGFAQSPDVGRLKTANSEYLLLQNVRGFGGLGAKRRGVQTRVILSSGIMGFFDLKVEGDPTSPDKIAVVTSDGSITIFDWSEFIATFEYLFATGIKLNLQAPNLVWYSVEPTSASNPAWKVTEIATPVSTTSTDLFIESNDLFGFNDASGIWRMYPKYVGAATIPGVGANRFATGSAITNFASAQSFTTGSGPVFTDEKATPQRWRLSVTNALALKFTSV